LLVWVVKFAPHVQVVAQPARQQPGAWPVALRRAGALSREFGHKLLVARVIVHVVVAPLRPIKSRSKSTWHNQSLQQTAGSLLRLLSFISRPAAAEFAVRSFEQRALFCSADRTSLH
jgi:hypothetical protein